MVEFPGMYGCRDSCPKKSTRSEKMIILVVTSDASISTTTYASAESPSRLVSLLFSRRTKHLSTLKDYLLLRMSFFCAYASRVASDWNQQPYLACLYYQVLAILRHQIYNKDCETNDYSDDIILILLV